jgi:hypothetical protein
MRTDGNHLKTSSPANASTGTAANALTDRGRSPCLRAARWIRESTGGQFDRYGPGSQREQEDRFIYLSRHAALKHDLVSVTDGPWGVTPSRAVEWLRSFCQAWARADVPEAKADVLHAIYERIVVAGPRIVSVRLTPAALSHGLALALSEAVMASPAGFEPATRCLEGSRSVH